MRLENKNMEALFDVIILGAGASGMMCACSIKDKTVAMVDVVAKGAKKLMVTGNGRCNLTNKKVDSSFYNTNIDKYLKEFNQCDTLNFFEAMGLVTYADEEGRVYPISNSAKSVVDVMNLSLKNNVTTFLGEKINKIDREKNLFLVETEKTKLKAKSIVVATGGNSAEILESLSVNYNEFVPSLVALKSDETRDLNGVKISNVQVTAKSSFGNIMTERGEVLFRENGLSGIVIFNISSLFAREKSFKGELSIDLLPDICLNALVEMILKRRKLGVRLDKIFVGMFHNAVANELFKQTKLNTNCGSSDLKEKDAYKLAKTIKNLTFYINGHLDNNQIFSGGVSLESLNPNLMHKKIPNLYFAGEVCDVDGVCGGYNLQWAWTSGHIVASSINSQRQSK